MAKGRQRMRPQESRPSAISPDEKLREVQAEFNGLSKDVQRLIHQAEGRIRETVDRCLRDAVAELLSDGFDVAQQIERQDASVAASVDRLNRVVTVLDQKFIKLFGTQSSDELLDHLATTMAAKIYPHVFEQVMNKINEALEETLGKSAGSHSTKISAREIADAGRAKGFDRKDMVAVPEEQIPAFLALAAKMGRKPVKVGTINRAGASDASKD